mmetsp:Transcript_28353/g.61128  ORF Transcript_28353/g.61128 Transcript_28353/m.61128 type:complete len:205 (+) Transcript_28353:858-1472(+)
MRVPHRLRHAVGQSGGESVRRGADRPAARLCADSQRRPRATADAAGGAGVQRGAGGAHGAGGGDAAVEVPAVPCVDGQEGGSGGEQGGDWAAAGVRGRRGGGTGEGEGEGAIHQMRQPHHSPHHSHVPRSCTCTCVPDATSRVPHCRGGAAAHGQGGFQEAAAALRGERDHGRGVVLLRGGGRPDGSRGGGGGDRTRQGAHVAD